MAIESGFAKLIVVLALATVSLLDSSLEANELAGSRPNIILVMTDDQGMGDLSCMGNEIVKTPNIDQFFRQSTRFTDFQVNPTCAPTRSAIMSGRAPLRNGVTHTIFQRERMALDVFTLPQMLESAGYETGIFGKWHLGDEAAYLPGSRGFKEVLIHGAGGIGQVGLGDFPPNKKNAYFDSVLLHNDTIVKSKGFCTDVFFNATLAWIKEQHLAKKRYFAYLSLNAPHGPAIAPESYKKRFLDAGYDNKTAGRYGMIENIDDNFGRLMAKLQQWNAQENTLVIFMTDNGMSMPRIVKNGNKLAPFNAGMKGKKNSPNEGGTHVPAFWQWKGVLGEGNDIDALTADIDLFPTFAELAGAMLPEKMQTLAGRSMLPLLENSSAEWPDRELFIHCGRWDSGKADAAKFQKCAVRTQRWRFVNNKELYDISADPGERNDVAASHPEIVDRLRKSYDVWWSSALPLMVNEGLPKVKKHPLHLRYEQQKKEQGIPKWKPDAGTVSSQQIEPTWESMAANYDPPEWFIDGKIGVWTHWGVPSSIDENRPNDGSHYGRRMYGHVEGEKAAQRRMSETLTQWHTERYGDPSEFGYEDLVPNFKAEKFDPDALVKFFKDNGARFVMPVATHHDNFDMYDSFHPWNAVDMGPKRDTIQEWKDAAHKQGLKFGVSTHLYWSPRFFKQARKYQTTGTLESKLFNMDYDPKTYARDDNWNEHWYARCWELIDKYDPDMFNNDSPFPDEKHGKSLGLKLFSSYLNRDRAENANRQTTVLSFKNPKVNREAFTYNLERGSSGEIQPEPWMWATDVSGGWFYRKGAVNRMSIPVMIGNAIDAISKNGVVMMNVALRGDGTLPENQAAYLTAFGEVLKINGEGIYGSRPWKVYGEGPLEIKTGRQGENKKPYSQQDIRFTTKDGNLYAFVLATPKNDISIKALATGGLDNKMIESIQLLGSQESIEWEQSAQSLTIKLPKTTPDQPVVGFKIQIK